MSAVPFAAGIACIEKMKKLDIANLLNEKGTKVKEGLTAAARKFGFDLHVTGMPSLFYLRIADDPTLSLHQEWVAECVKKMCIRDRCEEERLGGKSFGSTKSGIAPFYSDKYAKIGFQVSELFADETYLRDKIANVCVQKNILLENLYHKPALDPDKLYEELLEYRCV